MTTVDVICYKYKPLKTGELPLKIRVCKDRKTRYINLGVSTKAEYWDFGKNQPKPTCPNRELIEKLISNKISEVKSKIVETRSFQPQHLLRMSPIQVRLLQLGNCSGSTFIVLKRRKEQVTGYPSSRPTIHCSNSTSTWIFHSLIWTAIG